MVELAGAPSGPWCLRLERGPSAGGARAGGADAVRKKQKRSKIEAH